MIPTTPEAELRALGSLRRQCLFAVTILLVEDSRSASEAIRLYAAESGARVRRADSLHAASRHLADLPPQRGDGRPRPARRRRHGADPPPRLGLDAARRHRRAERPRARGLAGRGDRGRRGGLPREADREPARLPGVRALGPARRRDPARGRTRASSRSPGAPRSGRRSPRTCAARARSSPRRCRPATSRPWPTAPSSSARSARCSATPTSSPPPAAPPGPAAPVMLAASLERRLGAGGPGPQVA